MTTPLVQDNLAYGIAPATGTAVVNYQTG